MTDKLIDVLASEARTALDDPNSMAPAEWDKVRMTLNPNVNAGLVEYAIEKLDTIINALNPSGETRVDYAHALTVLGRQLEERADAMYQNELTYEDHADTDRLAYTKAGDALSIALDAIDTAIDALKGDDDDND